MEKTYLFYDIETTGLNKAFDQVLQFAAIRTDLNLNEIERHEILLRLLPDVVPSPLAILTHQICVTETINGSAEVDAITKIHQLFNTPGTISLGYNTLGFDDEVLRFSFYRNLLPPYTHQYANQCGRLDIYPITALYFLYKNDLLQWPKVDNKFTLKLERLSEANQLAVGAAHNAMVDVEATLALARKFQADPKMWQYAVEFFDKNRATSRFQKLSSAFVCKQQNFREGLLIDPSMGSERAYQVPVLALGGHNHYKNKTLWLRLDNEKLSQTTAQTIAENAWVYALKSGEANFILPLTERYAQQLSVERQQLIKQNKAWLLSNPDLFFQIINYHAEYTYPKIPELDIDAALYQNGFMSDQDQRLCAGFHAASWAEKASYIENFNPALRTQAIRLIGRNYPQYLPEKYAKEFADFINKAESIDYRGNKKLTANAALAEIAELKANKNLNEKQINLLDKLEQYLRNRQ